MSRGAGVLSRLGFGVRPRENGQPSRTLIQREGGRRSVVLLAREGWMPQFVVERELPGVGQLSPAELRKLAHRSCRVLDSLGPEIRWMHSYVTGGKLYCLYEARSESLILRHAALAGVPVTRIEMIATVMDPLAAWSQGQGAA